MRGLRPAVTTGLLLLAVLPALAGLVDLWLHRAEPFLPTGDHALLGMVVDAVGHHEVLLGPYSRFGWYHPGPMGAYLLAGPHVLLGGALQAMTVGVLVIGGLSAAGSVWLVRRRAGLVAGAWILLVLALSLQTLGDGFLRDTWNPHLPVLPFLVASVLCWTAVRGDAWALPVAVVPLSLAAQSHVGFLPAVGSVGAVLVAGLLLRGLLRLRRRRSVVAGEPQPERRLGRWVFAGVAAVAVGVLLWLPPVVQQVTGSPGNLEVLAEYLLEDAPEDPLGTPAALRAVADEFGRVPAQVMGSAVPGDPLLPARWPALAVGIGTGLFAVAMAVAVVRRRGDAVWLGILTLAVAAAAVPAIARVEGQAFGYLTRWTVVIGVLAWTTIGLALLPELSALVRRAADPRRTRFRPGTLLGVPVGALAAVAAAHLTLDTVQADTPAVDSSGELTALSEALLVDLERRGSAPGGEPVVRVDFATTTAQDVPVGTIIPGAGVVLALHDAEVDVQVADLWSLAFGDRYTARPDDADYVATVAYADGSSPPPEPWQQVLAVGDELQIYGGVPPAG